MPEGSDSRDELVTRWLDRIAARVALTPNRVFPTGELLNHVPLLIDGIAAYVERPGQDLDADVPVVAKAVELGALRHSQGSDAYEILKEHEMLGAIISWLGEIIDDLGALATPRELLDTWERIAHATGTVFAFSLPSRREEDAAAAGTKRPEAQQRAGTGVPEGSCQMLPGYGNRLLADCLNHSPSRERGVAASQTPATGAGSTRFMSPTKAGYIRAPMARKRCPTYAGSAFRWAKRSQYTPRQALRSAPAGTT